MAKTFKRNFSLVLALSFPFLILGSKIQKSARDENILADLPLEKLLVQKRAFSGRHPGPGVLSKSSGNFPRAQFLSYHLAEKDWKTSRKNFPQKTFLEDYHDEDKEWSMENKEKHKIHDVLNTSITALSYLAFGGYLLCMVVGALREKKRKFSAAYPYVHGFRPASHSQLTNVLQHYIAQNPVRVKFPAVTMVSAGKRRKKRSSENSGLLHKCTF